VGLAQELEDLSSRYVWSRSGERLLNALPQPVVEGSLLAIRGAQPRTDDLARRSVCLGLDLLLRRVEELQKILPWLIRRSA
jgi:hypothetical protein